MNKHIFAYLALSAALMLAGGEARSQSGVDFAVRMGSNEYFGTARTLGMGNAVTAIGGDLGSVGINPAGSAVNNYGQLVLSPGLSISSASTLFDSGDGVNPSSTYRSSKVRGSIPNAAFSFVFNTGTTVGLKNVSLSFSCNSTSNYNEYFQARGYNRASSFFSDLAGKAQADHIPESSMGNYSSNVSWDMVSAYRAQMIGVITETGEYVAGNEVVEKVDGMYWHFIPDDLSQMSSVQRYGSKTDLLFNVGLNFSDWFYLGVNLGIPIINYNYRESWSEQAVDPDKFPISNGGGVTENFISAAYDYGLNAKMTGIYGKIGAIIRPVPFFRLGLAVQTPVAFTASETWWNYVSSRFSSSSWNLSSPDGKSSYKFTGPWLFNAGAALTLWQRLLLSADYELTDYRCMKYGTDVFNDSYFVGDNDDIKEYCRIGHALRAGIEFRLTPAFSLRGGYNLTGAAIKEKAPVHSGSFGLGYSSNGKFFADLAARITKYPVSSFYPYLYSYVPVISVNNSSRWDVVLTVGWRF